MFALLIFIHLLAASVLILVVLLQSGKAGDLASTFGGSTSQTAFGARGAATILTKATTVAAVAFMFSSLGLSILYSMQTSETIMDSVTPSAVGTQEETADTPAAVPAAEEASQPEGEASDPDSSE